MVVKSKKSTTLFTNQCNSQQSNKNEKSAVIMITFFCFLLPLSTTSARKNRTIACKVRDGDAMRVQQLFTCCHSTSLVTRCSNLLFLWIWSDDVADNGKWSQFCCCCRCWSCCCVVLFSTRQTFNSQLRKMVSVAHSTRYPQWYIVEVGAFIV